MAHEHSAGQKERQPQALAGLVPSFFGIGLLRFWYQYNLYNLHATTDYGFQIALTNVLRALVIAVLLGCAFKHGLSPRVRGALVWSSLVLMTASGVLYALDLAFDSAALEVARYATCGVGLVWGGAMWMEVYARLEPRQVLVCLAGGVALSCAFSLAAGLIAPPTMALINLFVPVGAVLAYWRSLQILSERGRDEPIRVDCLYSERYRSGVGRAVWSFFLFAFVLGIALGFPDGTPRELPPLEQVLHQVVLAGICALAIWWASCRRGALWFPAVWCFENALLIGAIVLLVSPAPGTFEEGTALMLMAESVFYPFVFFVAYDLGRHMRRSALYMLGVVYGGALLGMGTGRLVSFWAEKIPGGTMAMTVAMSVLVVVELVVSLRFTATSGGLPLFSDLRASAAAPHEAPPVADPDVPPLSATPAPAAEKPCEVPVASPEPERRGGAAVAGAALTPVEQRIVELIAHGRSRAVIARELGYSENTIRNYTRNIYHKLDVHSKQELLDLLGEG